MPVLFTIIHKAEDVSSAGKATSPFGSFEISTKTRPMNATKWVTDSADNKISKLNHTQPLTETAALK